MKNLTRRSLIASGLVGASAVAIAAIPALANAIADEENLMTKKTDLPKLFRFDAKTNRIVCYCQRAGIATTEGIDAITVMAQMRDPSTKAVTDKILGMQLLPRDAYALAQAILVIAKRRGWDFPGGEMVEWPGGEKGKH
jgi:hypothetical protein